MKKRKSQINLPSNQQGATLIIVMMVMLMISLVAVASFQSGNLTMKVATSDQVQKLLFQSSDIAMAKVESESRNGDISNTANLLGYLDIENKDDTDTQLTFCLRPRQSTTMLLDVDKLTDKPKDSPAGEGHEPGKGDGYCNPGDDDDFISARNTSMTQVSVHELSSEESANIRFKREVAGTSLQGNKGLDKAKFYKMQATSIVPAYTDAPLGDHVSDKALNTMSGCLKQSPDQLGIDQCLKNLGIPYSSHEQLYVRMPKDLNAV